MTNKSKVGSDIPLKDTVWYSNQGPCTTPTAKLPKLKNYWTFGLKAPVIDFFEHGFVPEFLDLEEILHGGVKEVNRLMKEAGQRACNDEGRKDACPFTGVPKFRWIHIPTNNMEWVEVCPLAPSVQLSQEVKLSPSITDIWKRVIYDICKPEKKEKHRPDEPDEPVVYLSPEYWLDQQRGCRKHCTNNPLHARHMVPFFSEVLKGKMLFYVQTPPPPYSAPSSL